MTTSQKIYHEAALIRGYFINAVTYIEKLIECYIAGHLCNNRDRADEMIELLIGDRFVSFESKRTAFESIFKKHHSTLYKADKDKFEKLTTIQNQRNRFAHLIVSTNKEAQEKYIKDKAIGFVKFGEKTKPIWYEDKDTKTLMEILDEVSLWLKDLNEKQ